MDSNNTNYKSVADNLTWNILVTYNVYIDFFEEVMHIIRISALCIEAKISKLF